MYAASLLQLQVLSNVFLDKQQQIVLVVAEHNQQADMVLACARLGSGTLTAIIQIPAVECV